MVGIHPEQVRIHPKQVWIRPKQVGIHPNFISSQTLKPKDFPRSISGQCNLAQKIELRTLVLCVGLLSNLYKISQEECQFQSHAALASLGVTFR